MIVLFYGGGPANGLFKNFSTKKTGLRVGTPQLIADGMAASYRFEEIHPVGPRLEATTARFVGLIKSTEAMIDLVVEDQ